LEILIESARNARRPQLIKAAFAISAVIGLIAGAVAGEYILGIAVFNGLFVLGLLIIIAYSVQELVPKIETSSVVDDEDLIEEIELVFDENSGELIEVPARKVRRR
jgi:hypothetical protein